MATCITWFCF